MSEFHGGVFVPTASVDETRIVDAVRAWFARKKRKTTGHSLWFATRAAAPVVHVAVRGGDADGKGYCLFHAENLDLGGAIARAVGAGTWAYAYENQTGYEAVAAYDAKGAQTHRVEADWDDEATRLGLAHTSDGHAKLLAALPLGRLAAALDVPRSLLDMDLAYGASSCTVPLEGEVAAGAVARYLAGSLPPFHRASAPEAAAAGEREQSFYLPLPVQDEAMTLARRLGVPLGRVMLAAWETGKTALHAEVHGFDGEGNEAPPRAAPPVVAVEGLTIPDAGSELPPLPASMPADARKATLAMPERALVEMQALAAFADRSQSWCLRHAYAHARARLHAATR